MTSVPTPRAPIAIQNELLRRQDVLDLVFLDLVDNAAAAGWLQKFSLPFRARRQPGAYD
jgi:hypothetical protein